MTEEPFTLTSEAAKALSRLGAAKGGAARARRLPAERRSEIARNASAARWGTGPLPKATHKGNFKNDFGLDVDCYVLDDEQKTAVISQRGMGAALKLGAGGTRLPRFVEGKVISGYVGPELREKLSQPLIFLVSPGGPEAVTQAHGYDVTILVDICKAIVTAEEEGKLLPHQKNIARQAHVILSASAKAGIKGLVYALAGYDAPKEETIAAFKFFVRQEAREWEKEFPDQLYEEWYRLYDIQRQTKTCPWRFAHLTVDQVYFPLAKSNGRILELTRAQRANAKARYRKLHQFLSDIGVKALRSHLGQLLGIAKISATRGEYERHFQTLFGDQLVLALPEPQNREGA